MDLALSLPLYKQISALIMREILAGRLEDGERLPPERELAAELGCSVGTLRKGLEDLEAEGVLERVHGSGNYVRAGAEISGLYSFFRLELCGGGGVPTAQVLEVQDMPAPEEFQIGSRGHRIRRTRALDGQIVAAEEIWLARDRSGPISKEDLGDSLYQFYKHQLGLWIARVQDSVGVGVLPPWAAARLSRSDAEVVGFVQRIGWAQDGARVEGSYTWFDPALCRYFNRMA